MGSDFILFIYFDLNFFVNAQIGLSHFPKKNNVNSKKIKMYGNDYNHEKNILISL
jgi:hypothetical protein